jgi:hypothetical protein
VSLKAFKIATAKLTTTNFSNRSTIKISAKDGSQKRSFIWQSGPIICPSQKFIEGELLNVCYKEKKEKREEKKEYYV